MIFLTSGLTYLSWCRCECGRWKWCIDLGHIDRRGNYCWVWWLYSEMKNTLLHSFWNMKQQLYPVWLVLLMEVFISLFVHFFSVNQHPFIVFNIFNIKSIEFTVLAVFCRSVLSDLPTVSWSEHSVVWPVCEQSVPGDWEPLGQMEAELCSARIREYVWITNITNKRCTSNFSLWSLGANIKQHVL